MLHSVISQLITSFQIIENILNKTETAISFVKASILHNIVVQPILLINEIKSINIYLSDAKLLFHSILESVPLLGKVLKVKLYSKSYKLMFLIEIPLVRKESYNYFHLYSLPIQNSFLHSIIVPSNKFLILN